MANRHEKMFKLPSHKENLKTTVRFYLIPVRLAYITTTPNNPLVVRMWGEKYPIPLLGGLLTGAAILEVSMEKTQVTSNPTPGNGCKRCDTHEKAACTPVFISVQSTIAKTETT